MRTLFLVLLLANLAFFAWQQYFRESGDDAAQIAALQINPEKIRPLAIPGSAPAAALPAAPTPPPAACLEWGSFTGPDVARADGALAALALPAEALQRRVVEVDGWWVHMPVMKTKPELDRKVGELKGLGVTDFYVVQEPANWRNAISLGLFKSEDAANAELERLRKQGVRSAQVTRREKFLRQVSFFVREPGAATAARITELQRDFPAAEIKAVTCPALAPSK